MPPRTKPSPVLAVLCACLFTTATRAADLQAPSTAVWIQPVAPLLFLAPPNVPAPPSWNIIYIPVGATFATGGPMDLSFEASYFQQTLGIAGWSASTGALIHLPNGHALNGFVLQPKLIVTQLSVPAVYYAPGILQYDAMSTLSFELGVDFGYQATIGPLYIASIVGLSGGVCTDCAGGLTPSLWNAIEGVGSHGPGPKAVYGLNLNLLRIGAAF